MQVFDSIIDNIMKVFQTNLQIFGYNLSLWSVFLYLVIGCILLGILKALLDV